MSSSSSRSDLTYRLVRPSAPTLPPVLDADQQRVVDHPGGPLLVLAGPGTGKTTTLVEAIADRIENRGVHPDSILALTFSRKAAEQLRDRVAARVGRTMSSSMSSTFHSFAFGLIRAASPVDLYEAPLRLLSAPEADVVLRELLTDNPESIRWPDSLSRALGTQGFVHEVQAVLSRAREKGLDGAELRALGEEHDLPEFVAAGRFLDQYLTVLDNLGATDYADLIRRATIEAEANRAALRARWTDVFVDEYQDTDPGQVALLRALAGDGRNLTVVGDPHQSVYGFRGAEVRGILDFPRDFPHADGSRAPVVVLGNTRRYGPRIAVAAQRVASRLSLAGSIDAQSRAAFLSPEPSDVPGRVEVCTFDTDRAEAERVADLLRRAHLEDGVPWERMAVLVRSGRSTLPPLRRSLAAAGVPVEVAGDDLPLVRDPAVLPLLDALRAVVNLDNDDPDHVDYLDPGRVEALLLSPLGGMDAGGLRALSRRLRAREKEAAHDVPPRSSRTLLREAVTTAGFLDDLDGPDIARARALAGLLHRSRARLEERARPEEVLWDLWSGTDWPSRLTRGIAQGGGAARRAHRDLDAVCALFESAAKAEDQRDHLGVRAYLASLLAQQIPGDSLAERGVRGAAVRLLTAHRSKGLEWDLVVVAHVQAEAWPDLRRRTTLLRADRIGARSGGAGEVVPPVTQRELLMEERRLFYVACTRARRRLVVTAVAAADDDGDQPSRFLGELGVTPSHVVGRPARPLSLGGVVADLRRTVADPTAHEPLRAAAARRLARLAAENAGSRPLIGAADPATWWGTRARTRSVQPLRDPDQPVPLSASLVEAVMVCPAQWFWTNEAGGRQTAHQSANLGQIVHALAHRVAGGDLPADVDTLMHEVDAVWERLAFRTPWSRQREYDRIQTALGRFVTWHRESSRSTIATEQGFSAMVEVDGEQVLLRGYADRLEVDADGRVVVVDLKTSRGKPTNPAVQRHIQLSLYQYAVDQGAVDSVVGGQARSGGAELVQLGLTDGDPVATVQSQAIQSDESPEREVLRSEVTRTAGLLRSETFPAVVGQQCRDCAFLSICPAKSAGSVTS